jgi:hypothetical protein
MSAPSVRIATNSIAIENVIPATLTDESRTTVDEYREFACPEFIKDLLAFESRSFRMKEASVYPSFAKCVRQIDNMGDIDTKHQRRFPPHF